MKSLQEMMEKLMIIRGNIYVCKLRIQLLSEDESLEDEEKIKLIEEQVDRIKELLLYKKFWAELCKEVEE